MAKEKKLVEAITSREEDFAQWYTDVVKKAELVVRCNPIHDTLPDYVSSEEEIKRIVDLGADYVMLPYFKTPEEVEKYIDYVDKLHSLPVLPMLRVSIFDKMF